MSRADYGRAFKIRSKDVHSYDRTRQYKSNPMGVTTLAQVNGRGAYSARSAAKGKTKSQRIAAARELLNGGNTVQKRGRRASFVSNATPAAKRRGKRLAAYNDAKRRGLTPNSAARSALRKVPWTASERSGASSFQGMKAKARKNPGSKKKMRRNPTAAQYEKEVAERQAARATKSVSPKTKRSKGKRRKATPKRKTKRSQYTTVQVQKRVRVSYGKYKRVRMRNPSTGKTQYSYMYRTKGGNLRRIPTSAIVGKKVKGTKELPARVRKARARAAKRIIQSGGAFVPNKRRSRARMRATEKGRLVRKGMSKAKAAKAALRKYPFTETEKRAGKKLTKSGKITVAKAASKRKTRKSSTKRAAPKRRITKRRSAKLATTKRAAPKRRTTKRRSAKRAAPKRRTTKRRSAKRAAPKRATKRSMAAKKGWRTRKRKYAGRKGFRKNQDKFMALLTTGALVGVGFLLHRGLTAGACMLFGGGSSSEELVPENGASGVGRYRRRRRRGLRGLGQTNGEASITKPLIGASVAVVGSIAAIYVAGEAGPAVAGGMIASALGQVLVYGLKATGQTELAAALGGYSNSMAYSLRGPGRPGRRGAIRSIMPQYRPVGAFTQAAAGTHNPNRAMGEYFQPNSVGEYFAPANMQGVGSYEPAGQLAMQAAAGMGQIDDGIRPDTNLDRVLDLAEAAAGLRGVGAAQFAQAAAGMPGGIGEYITAERKNGEFAEQRVPTSSQWVPNGPLWAGTLGVTGDRQTSDIPAGVLAGQGGNGILSGG